MRGKHPIRPIPALLDFLNRMPAAERERFASYCETSFDYLRQVAYGNRGCSAAIAVRLERESGGALACEALCPEVDWRFVRRSARAAGRGRACKANADAVGARAAEAHAVDTPMVDARVLEAHATADLFAAEGGG